MSASGEFWLGLAFAIPLSIIANLFTPKIQDWLSRRSSVAAKKRQVVRAKEQSRIDEYLKDPARLNTFLLTTLLVATMFGSVIGAFTALLYVMGTVADGRFGSILAQGMSVFAGLFITKICFDAVNISIKVRQAQKAIDEAHG